MQVLIQVLFSLTSLTRRKVFFIYFFYENEYIEYRKKKPNVSFTRKASRNRERIGSAIVRGSNKEIVNSLIQSVMYLFIY